MSTGEPAGAQVVFWMLVFVLAGAPFVYLIWDFINEILQGRFVPATAGLAVVGTLGLLVVLRLVAARARVWDGGER